MRIRELLDTAWEAQGPHNDQPFIDTATIDDYHESLWQAYDQAKLNPETEHRQCPYVDQDGDLFQVELSAIPARLLGSRYLIESRDKEYTDEVDIFMNHLGTDFDVSSGRLSTPDSKYLTDYHVTESRLRVVTDFVLFAYKNNMFQPGETQHRLSVPQ